MISSAAPGSNSWTWNSALRLMLLWLKVYCHLPINFQCGAYYLAANGKPTHAAHHLVDCISLINPCLPPLHPPLHSCLFLFYLYFTQQRAEKTLNAKKNWAFLLSGCVCMYITPLRWAERAVRGVLCCWSPPLPFACLSDVLLGWAPHSDGVDKMTGGGHTPVNVNLASMHRSADAPIHQSR